MSVPWDFTRYTPIPGAPPGSAWPSGQQLSSAAAPARPGEAAWSRPWTMPYGRARGTPGWDNNVDQSYRWFEPDVREFYEDNPTLAYQGFVDWGFGDRQRPLLDYARGYYNRAYAQAMAGQEGANAVEGQTTPPTGGQHWVDYLTPELVYQIRQSFNMQSASNRGVTNMWLPAGRWTG